MAGEEHKPRDGAIGVQVEPGIWGRALRSTATALSLSTVPMLYFLFIILVLGISSPELRQALADPNTARNMMTRAAYYSYFSIASILLFSMKDDLYRDGKIDWWWTALYIMAFVTFANQVIAFLMDELALPTTGAFTDSTVNSGTIIYLFTIVLLYTHFILKGLRRQRDAGVKPPAPAPTPAPSSKARPKAKAARTKAPPAKPAPTPRIVALAGEHWKVITAVVVAVGGWVAIRYVPATIMSDVALTAGMFGSTLTCLNAVSSSYAKAKG